MVFYRAMRFEGIIKKPVQAGFQTLSATSKYQEFIIGELFIKQER